MRSARQTRLLDNSAGARCLALSPDGRRLLSGHDDKSLRLWDGAGGILLRVFQDHAGPVTGAAFTGDQRRAVSVSEDGSLRLWDLDSGKCLATIMVHNGPVTALGLSPDGLLALTGGQDKTLRLWSVITCKHEGSFVGHEGPVSAAAFAGGGRLVVSASEDATLRVWEAASGECLRVLSGHAAPVRAAAVLPDGRGAVSASSDGRWRLWDLETGRCLHESEAAGAVNALCITSDGAFALAAAEGGDLKVLHALTGAPAGAFAGHSARLTAVVEAPGPGSGPPEGAVFTCGADGIRSWGLEWERAEGELAVPYPRERQGMKAIAKLLWGVGALVALAGAALVLRQQTSLGPMTAGEPPAAAPPSVSAQPASLPAPGPSSLDFVKDPGIGSGEPGVSFTPEMKARLPQAEAFKRLFPFLLPKQIAELERACVLHDLCDPVAACRSTGLWDACVKSCQASRSCPESLAGPERTPVAAPRR
ncbi:MAG: WD40 repeat domain-containing protein [Elusimicrobia bacterium]|nr:WD40 repeat domain-containing protein [Elusimicrobiota bacterium]